MDQRTRHTSGAAGSRRHFVIAGARVTAGIALVAGVPGLRVATAGTPVTRDTRGARVALAFDAAGGSLLKSSPDALYRSSDGGLHWTAVALPATAVPSVITSIAVTAGAKRSLYVAGFGIGVMRSDDGGRHWSARNSGLPSKDVAALAAHAERPATVYAYISGKGFFRSEDRGQRWRLMDAGPRGGITRFVHSNMPGSMQSGWLFAASPKGVQRSMDCFCGWRAAGEIESAVHAVAYDPRQPRSVYAATDAALLSSHDGGETWSPSAAPAAGIKALVVTPDGVLFAADADGRLSRRRGTDSSWERVDG